MRAHVLAATRFKAIILSDAAMREVDAGDVTEWLAANRADARAGEQFRAAERDAAYDAAERGGE